MTGLQPPSAGWGSVTQTDCAAAGLKGSTAGWHAGVICSAGLMGIQNPASRFADIYFEPTTLFVKANE
jgi:hypothetical protein